MKTISAPAAIGAKHALPISALALLVAIIAELIGKKSFDIGIGTLLVFPMVWGLLIGTVLTLQKFKPVSIRAQKIAASFSAVAVLLLVVRLAADIGPQIPVLVSAGPALFLQEIGHLLGTIVLALPLAVLLRMGRSTVGATFSIDRESSFAMVSARFGSNSDEYRGVLAMYVFGTIFGAIYISLLTSVVASWGIFDPLAMAMGAGVGSGSMMAASAASIAAAHPEMEQAILSMAAVSNLITTIMGTYVGMFVALPLANRCYNLLTGAKRKAQAATTAAASGELADQDIARSKVEESNAQFAESASEVGAVENVPLWVTLPVLSIMGIATAVIAEGFTWQLVFSYVIISLLVVLGAYLAKLTKNKIPSLIWLTTLIAAACSPISPIADFLVTTLTAVPFLSITTVVLTCAGLSLGKDVGLLKKIGWKIVPVGLVAITASFVLATIIAEFALGLWH
ncbi:DUF3100 domain-containing protein [Glutamicibacter endophyticus]